MTNNTNPMNAMMAQGFRGLGANATTQNNPFKALGFLGNIQIGSSSIVNYVRMGSYIEKVANSST